jgi:NADH:ubiquinone reductase (H+-translocating)
MLGEVVSGNIGILDTVSPLRRLIPKTRLYVREIESIDLDGKEVRLTQGFRPRLLVLKYDHLVLALGNVTDFHGMPGLHEHAMPFKDLADALHIRNHVLHVPRRGRHRDRQERG